MPLFCLFFCILRYTYIHSFTFIHYIYPSPFNRFFLSFSTKITVFCLLIFWMQNFWIQLHCFYTHVVFFMKKIYFSFLNLCLKIKFSPFTGLGHQVVKIVAPYNVLYNVHTSLEIIMWTRASKHVCGWRSMIPLIFQPCWDKYIFIFSTK